MKKKIRDLTIEELMKICKTCSCDKCPFNDYYELCMGINTSRVNLGSEDLDKEVEI